VIATSDLHKLAVRSSTYIKRFSLAVNVVLYGLFVVLVIVFQLNKPSAEQTCGNRIAIPTNDSVRRAISIAYAVVIATLSFIISAGFLSIGWKLNNQIQNTQKILHRAENRKVL
jgi:hypothetical protein